MCNVGRRVHRNKKGSIAALQICCLSVCSTQTIDNCTRWILFGMYVVWIGLGPIRGSNSKGRGAVSQYDFGMMQKFNEYLFFYFWSCRQLAQCASQIVLPSSLKVLEDYGKWLIGYLFTQLNLFFFLKNIFENGVNLNRDPYPFSYWLILPRILLHYSNILHFDYRYYFIFMISNIFFLFKWQPEK